MNQFSDLLKDLNRRIKMPQPEKSRILLEIAADLNDAYAYYRERGLSREDALQKARDKFELSDEAIDQLSRLHDNVFHQWMLNKFGSSQSLCERILFTVFSLFIIVAAVYAAMTTAFYTNASGFVYPVPFILIGVLILSAVKIYRLYLKEDHGVTRINAGMGAFKIFAAANLFAGISGYFAELYFSGSKVLFLGPLFIISMLDVDYVETFVLDFMIKTSLLIMMCMLTVMITGIFWFIIANKISKIEQAEAEILLAE